MDAVPVGAEAAHFTAVQRVSTVGYRATADGHLLDVRPSRNASSRFRRIQAPLRVRPAD